jgi:Fe-S cluster biogenesis protein NfuA
MAGQVGGKASDVRVVADPIQGGVGSSKQAQSEKEKDVATAAMSGGATGCSSSGERVEQMIARLRMTAPEAKAVVIDDADDPGLVDLDRAFVGCPRLNGTACAVRDVGHHETLDPEALPGRRSPQLRIRCLGRGRDM